MPRPPARLRPFRPPSSRPAPSPPGGELAVLVNLGPQSCAWLADAGITTRSQLERLGAIEACRRVLQAGHPVSLVLAYAIEGGLMGCHWNALPGEFKQHLRQEFARMKRSLNR